MTDYRSVRSGKTGLKCPLSELSPHNNNWFDRQKQKHQQIFPLLSTQMGCAGKVAASTLACTFMSLAEDIKRVMGPYLISSVSSKPVTCHTEQLVQARWAEMDVTVPLFILNS